MNLSFYFIAFLIVLFDDIPNPDEQNGAHRFFQNQIIELYRVPRTTFDPVVFFTIDPDTNQIGEMQVTNVITALDSNSMNRDGTVMTAHGKILNWNETIFEVADLQEDNPDCVFSSMSSDGQFIGYCRNQDSSNFFSLYDRRLQTFVAGYSFPSEPVLNRELTTFAFIQSGNQKYHWFTVDRNGSTFSEPIPVAPYENKSKMRFHLSHRGQRFFYTRGDEDDSVYTYHYVDRQSDRWSEPVELLLPRLTLERFLPTFQYLPIIYDTAEEGRTLLIYGGEQGFAIIHETEQGWTKPEFLGLNTINPYTDYGHISEDGRVVVVTIFNRERMDEWGDGKRLDVYIKNPQGNWVEHKDVVKKYIRHSHFSLSDDGTRLFVLPIIEMLGCNDWFLHP